MRISELSRRVGVSADTLRVWERRYGLLQPRRSIGNARLYSSLDEARIRLMKHHLSQHVPAAQAAELTMTASLTLRPGQGPAVPDDDARRSAARMRAALDVFDESSAEAALQSLLGEYSTLAVIGDVLLPYLRDVGDRWAAEHMTVAQEHFASNFVHSRLLALARGWDRGLGPRVLLACAPADQHNLALIAFGIALHKLGWRVTYLGSDTPVEMVDSAATQTDPDLIVISTYRPGALDPDVSRLRDLSRRWRLGLGGAGADTELAARCHADHLRDDPITAARSIATAALPRALARSR